MTVIYIIVFIIGITTGMLMRLHLDVIKLRDSTRKEDP